MTVEELIKILNKIDDKTKMVLDNNSQEIINIHVSTNVVYLEPNTEQLIARNINI